MMQGDDLLSRKRRRRNQTAHILFASAAMVSVLVLVMLLYDLIAGDKNALGFFGFAYYVENTDKLKVVKIDGGNGPIEPTFETIKDGSYAPLSRPLFLYVTKDALAKDHVRGFLTYYLTEGTALIPEVGYVPLEDALYEAELAKLN